MTYNKFVEKYLGRYLDYDGIWQAQCTDLMRGFSHEVHGYKPYVAIPNTGNAKDIFYRFRDNQYYKKILNTPTGVPKQGDFVFFKTSIFFPFLYGIPGHVAIVDSANVKEMIVLEQNYPTGRPVKMRRCGYKDCLGWITKA